MNLRKTTSLTALLAFAGMLVTSVILYIVPQGRIAYWSDWHLWGLSKTEWGNLHINLGTLFLVALFLHIYYNWRPILRYLQDRRKAFRLFTPDFTAALTVTAVVALGTWFFIPPFSTFLDIGTGIKDAAAQKYGEPPFGHAELASLESLAKKTGLDPKQAQQNLTKAGIAYQGPDETLLTIARNNRLSPKEVFEVMGRGEPALRSLGLPEIPPPGVGRRSLAEISEEYSLDLAAVIQGLADAGFTAQSSATIRDLADQYGKTPVDIYDLIRGIAVN